jgi:hypothetical protein
MSRFGWANVEGAYAKGVSGSVQYKDGDSQHLAGSSKFVFDENTGLVVTGNVSISGTLSANEYRVNVVDETITRLYSQGSSKFGNSTDDTHNFVGSTVLSGASDSAFIYQVTSSIYSSLSSSHKAAISDPGTGPASYFYLTSSVALHRGVLNYTYDAGGGSSGSVADVATYVRSINPTLVVSGAAIFKNPVSIQGGLFGASPIDIYAPLAFQRDDLTEVTSDDIMKIQQGKFVGNVIISSSNDNHGLWMEGAGYFVMNSKKTLSDNERAPEIVLNNRTSDQQSYSMIAQRKMQAVPVAENPYFIKRKGAGHIIGETRFSTEFPVLTGSDSSSAAHYQRYDYDVGRMMVSTSPRRGGNAFTFQILDANWDSGYEALHAANSAQLNVSGWEKPIILSDSPLYDANNRSDQYSLNNIAILGGFSNPGQGNEYGMKRGMHLYGNLMPAGWPSGDDAGFEDLDAKDCTIGHPVARWGDLFVHEDRYIKWGVTAFGAEGTYYKGFYNDNPLTASARNQHNTVTLGYNSSSAFLEVSGAALYAKHNINLPTSGYFNFGTTKGTGGYGLRDNGGTLQVKTQAGSWQNLTPTLQGIISNGNVATSPITASTLRLTALAAGTATTSSYLALDSNNNIVLTSSSGGGEDDGGTIGAPEDGSYTDGLFTDFTNSTPVGTPIDRYNEVLKILAPAPAPVLSRIGYDDTTVGVAAKLSFDASNTITGYTASSTAGGFSAVTRNNSYEFATSGNNFKLGTYNGTQEITGTLNFTTGESVTNGNLSYASGAFGNAETGSLKLELNGTVIHEVVLTGAVGTGNPATGSATSYTNGSGFTHLSVTASSIDGNGADWYIFKHRTAKYKIQANDQKVGWNYLRVIHTITSTNNATNYIEWINDATGAGQALSVLSPRITSVSLTGSKYLSGVQYNTGLTASYRADVTNMYRNVYPSTSNTITFNPTNASTITAQSVPAIGGGENENKLLQLTASVVYNSNYLLNGTISTTLSATHPLKANLSGTGSASITGMLIDASASTNSNILETFEDEDYRITSGSYTTQNSVTAGAATWSSQNHMTSSGAAGHEDGMLYYNRRLYYPKDADIPNTGNFSTLANVSSGQPNYNAISGIRTYYRKIQNTLLKDIRDLKITSEKNGFKYASDATGLDTNDSHFYVKIPGSTGWMNIRENFTYGSTSDGNGGLIDGADDNSSTTGTGDSVHCVTFGTQSVSNNEYVVVKIETNGMQGYISKLNLQLGASDVSDPTEAPLLDDIDLDDAAGATAKLSFGSSNAVDGYTGVTGGKGSMGPVNSNAAYTDNGDTNRGVFKTIEVMNGTLNEDVSSNGDNYAANSFKNAYTGSLLLIVNDTTASTLSLDNLNTNNNLSSDTGFSVGAVAWSTTTDGIPDYRKTYRTGTYGIGTSQQRSGWNYARVIHRIGGTDTTTNYVQWVIDTSGAVDNTTVSTPVISNFNHPTSYYQSGIKYFASNPSGSFAFTGSNFYNNVHQSGSAISFPTTTNCAVSNIRVVGSGITTFDSAASSCDMPALNNSTDCELTDIQVTGTMLYDGSTPSISGGLGLFTDRNVTVTGRILHPLKSDRTTNSASKTSFMIYSGSIGSTTLTNNEYFNTETYRVVSGNYADQAALTSSNNTWNSQTVMNNGGTHDDGMVSVNGYALSPFKIGNLGDTRNVADGGSLQTPTGNPNYSTLTNSTRTFYRQFKYTSASTVASFNLKIYGDANLAGKSGTYAASLGENKNCFVELKIPYDPNYPGADDQSTDWADCAKIFESSAQPNVLGAGIRAGSFSGEDQTIDGDGLDLSLTLGTRRIKQNQYFVVKISVDEDWTGYISRIQVTY